MSIKGILTTGAIVMCVFGLCSLGHTADSPAPAPVRSVAVQAAQPQDEAPSQSVPTLGAGDPIVPLVCGANLDCSDVDRMLAAQAKPKAKKSASSRTVRTSHSSNGASSTSVTTKTPAGSSTVTKSRTAKGVTTTSTSTTTSR